jgi:O-antigen/teichoic acid export membrane protein
VPPVRRRLAGNRANNGARSLTEPVPVTPALDQETLRRRAKLGVFLLAGRTALQQLMGLGGTVYLARVLGPGEFGAFWIVQFVLSFFMLFGDAGFGAALIQKKHEATAEELSSVFWAQLLLGTLVVLVVFVSAPYVVQFWPGLPTSGVWMLRALSLSLLLTSSRVIPAILLERELHFGRLSFIDLVLTASFNGVAVALAYLGYGPFALVGGVLAQGILGLITAYALRPWRPLFRFSREGIRPILTFGLTFQAKNIVGFANAAVMPLYAGTALGAYSLGIVTWSQNTAFFPLQIVAILARVNFPLLSRLQHDPAAFVQTLGRTVKVCATVSLLFVALFLGLGPALVRVIYGQQWVPALPTLYVFALSISIGFIVPIMGGALDALGKPNVMMRLGVYWTIINWVAVTAVMHFRSDALTFSLAYCVHIVVGNLAVVFAVRKLLPEARIWRQIRAGCVGAIAVAALGRWLILPWAKGPATLALAVLLALGAFGLLLAMLDREGLRELTAMLRRKPATLA